MQLLGEREYSCNLERLAGSNTSLRAAAQQRSEQGNMSMQGNSSRGNGVCHALLHTPECYS